MAERIVSPPILRFVRKSKSTAAASRRRPVVPRCRTSLWNHGRRIALWPSVDLPEGPFPGEVQLDRNCLRRKNQGAKSFPRSEKREHHHGLSLVLVRQLFPCRRSRIAP